jgi:dTDP-4-amino-4,6-dideoxy-D-galactose acyltransferase
LITPLPFDSSLFGYPVGKCQIDESWIESDFLKEAKHFKLVYLFSDAPFEFKQAQLFPVDVRLSFVKSLEYSISSDTSITLYNGDLTEGLLSLALESGVYSRFYTDPRFVHGEFEKLYRRWIEKEVSQNQVLLAKNQTGFVSCEVINKEAQIGLIAVNKDQRGKGWGKKLVQAAENFAIQKGAQTMTIGTQAANLPASALYQSMGYQLIERKYIHHYWG